MLPITIGARVTIPAHALSLKAVRSGGPGGQNVNKVATKIELRVELGAIEGLTAAQRRRLAALARRHLDADGLLLVTSQLTRHQPANVEDARQKVARLVASSLVAPKRRIATKPSRGVRARRADQKKAQSEKKRARRWQGEP